jgi:hypothetical protein
LVEQPVLVLPEPVKTLIREGAERHLTTVKVAASRPVPPLGGRTEVGDALGEQLLAVWAEEPDQGGEVQEAPVIVLAHFDYEIPIAHERCAVGYLDLDVAGPWLLKCIPGCFPYKGVQARPDTRTILTPGTDLQ